jgi:ankyrin repeat protein
MTTTSIRSRTLAFDTNDSSSTDDESLLLLLRDAIVQHSSLTDIRRILRYSTVSCIEHRSFLLHMSLSFSCKQMNINGCVRRGLRALHYATYENDLECVRLLIEEYRADVNVLDEAGYSPLHLAAKYGYIDIMHVLIDHGSLINFHRISFVGIDTDISSTNNNQTRSLKISYADVIIEPLSLCLENNHIDCARLLICSGANVNQQYFLGYEINLLPYENPAALELMLKHGADSNAISRSGITPLIKACREGNRTAVVLLCRYGVTRKFRARNALVTAIEMKRTDLVEQLLTYGGFVNRHPELSNSPLELAIRNDALDIVKLLIGKKKDLPMIFVVVDSCAFSKISVSTRMKKRTTMSNVLHH